jgi:hypothetical protein
MKKLIIHACAIGVLALPLAGCFSYSRHESEERPPVVVKQPPPAGSTVVVPRSTY